MVYRQPGTIMVLNSAYRSENKSKLEAYNDKLYFTVITMTLNDCGIKRWEGNLTNQH